MKEIVGYNARKDDLFDSKNRLPQSAVDKAVRPTLPAVFFAF